MGGMMQNSTARARNTDPQTSHKAAAGIQNITQLQGRIMEVFMDAPMHSMGYTDDELIKEYGRMWGNFFPSSDASLRTRRSELVARKLIKDSGQKRPSKNGHDSTVWMVEFRLF
jgi:hypothetical protein